MIETLSEFVVRFCENLQICLNESEVLKLMEVCLSVFVSVLWVKWTLISLNLFTLGIY